MSQAPKKGSFKEIIARAAAAPQPALPAGTIVHQRSQSHKREAPSGTDGTGRISKPSSQRRANTQSPARPRTSTTSTAPSSSRKPGLRLKGSVKGSTKEQRDAIIREKKLAMIAARKSSAPVYAGTARPSSNAQLPSTVSSSRTNGRYAGKIPPTQTGAAAQRRRPTEDRYMDTDEEDLDDGYGGDGDGDESDDMEATGFEAIEAEERRSAAIARREDLVAEREEAEHQRAKAAKRRGLQRGVRG